MLMELRLVEVIEVNELTDKHKGVVEEKRRKEGPKLDCLAFLFTTTTQNNHYHYNQLCVACIIIHCSRSVSL